jgi:transcriptional regulator with XRE-family HTH domain
MTPQQLKEARLRLGLTITDMAKRLNNTPRGTYKKWERGENRIPASLELAVKWLELEVEEGE